MEHAPWQSKLAAAVAAATIAASLQFGCWLKKPGSIHHTHERKEGKEEEEAENIQSYFYNDSQTLHPDHFITILVFFSLMQHSAIIETMC